MTKCHGYCKNNQPCRSEAGHNLLCHHHTFRQIGGQHPIIHIAGAQGSGKTTIGRQIIAHFGQTVHVVDLDDLRVMNDQTIFQKYVDQFISEHNDKPLIITGLSAEMCLGVMDDTDQTFVTINTPYRYYIDMDNDMIIKQRFFRQIDKLSTRREQLFSEWLSNADQTQEKLIRFINLSQWKTNNYSCIEIHKQHNYIFLKPQEILAAVCDVLRSK